MFLPGKILQKKYGLKAVLFLVIALIYIITPGKPLTSDTIQTSEKYASQLIQSALDQKLYNDQYWHTLLHYKKRTFRSGYKSLIDDPDFFLSENGKFDPAAEIEATIRAFFEEKEEDTVHATEKFSARYKWLREKLDINIEKLPHDGDVTFLKNYYEQIKPAKAVLVFSSGYLGNPASMYGHTFLLIESEDGSRLTANAISYAAHTGETLGPLFAIMGLIGMYKGYYSFEPYYEKILNYNDVEMRDMWEYELDLTPEQLEMLIRHTIEMENIYSYYYFIDENCSYNLLFLIEAARPESRITDSFFFGVEPVDTIRVAKEKGLISERRYRPSLYAKMNYLRSQLDKNQQRTVRDIGRGKIEAAEIDAMDVPEKTRAVMYELTADYLKFLAARGAIDENEYRTRFLQVLRNRSRLGKMETLADMPEPHPPEDAHKSTRLTAESGYALRGLYSHLGYRMSAHHLMDPDEGHIPNSQVVLGNLELRYYYEEEKPAFHRFDVFNVRSFPLSDMFYLSPCFEFKTGFLRNVAGEEEELSYRFKLTIGLSTLLTEKSQIYFLTGGQTFHSLEYDKYTDLHTGVESGIILTAGPWKGILFGKYYYVPIGINRHIAKAGFSQRLKLTGSVSLMADYSYNTNYGHRYHEASMNFNYYF